MVPFGLWAGADVPTAMAWGMMGAACITLPVLLFGPTAPYGRYSTASGWGFLIPAKIAWFSQEIPSFVIPFFWIIFTWPRALEKAMMVPAHGLLMCMFLVHYFNRDLIFPWRLQRGSPTPCTVWFLAFVFCVYNGYMQMAYLMQPRWHPATEAAPSVDARWLAGATLWAVGLTINIDSDERLLRLRKKRHTKKGDEEKKEEKKKEKKEEEEKKKKKKEKKEKKEKEKKKKKEKEEKKTSFDDDDGATECETDSGRYGIPRGGMFEYVSAANYFGEIVEWIGFAIASWSLPAVAFAIFTFANLAPRGASHHAWYQRRFGASYPSSRRAIIPFLW